LLEPLLPPGPGGGQKRTTDLREVVNAILSVDNNGCAWRALPPDLPPEGTVHDYCPRWRQAGVWERILDTLRQQVRRRQGKGNGPTAAIVDSQSVPGARTSGIRGDDAGKKVKGTKRYLLVDTLGLLLCVVVHAANLQNRDGAKLVFARARQKYPGVRLVWAEGGYAGKLIGWLQQGCGWVLEIVKRNELLKGGPLLPRRWVVERTISWVTGHRRLSKDYEYWPQTSEAFIEMAMIHLMLHRLCCTAWLPLAWQKLRNLLAYRPRSNTGCATQRCTRRLQGTSPPPACSAHRGGLSPWFASARTLSCHSHGRIGLSVLPRSCLFLPSAR
jgi:putative transposase